MNKSFSQSSPSDQKKENELYLQQAYYKQEFKQATKMNITITKSKLLNLLRHNALRMLSEQEKLDYREFSWSYERRMKASIFK